jgi:LCP family protein required for cell wall assembly
MPPFWGATNNQGQGTTFRAEMTGRHLWKRRWFRVTAIVAALAVVAGATEAGWLAYRYASLRRVDIAKGVLAGGASRNEPQNYLLVGTDSRAFVTGQADAAAYGTTADVGLPHADTILLVRTFPATGKVALVSFPRDLWVPVSGTPGSERINTAIQGGGPARLIKTIGEDFGIAVHHYVEIDFRGFKGLVNSVGGVDVPFAARARDWDEQKQINPTGLVVDTPGCVRLGGDQALAYVRSRHYQQFVDGAWRPDPAGDLNRIARQQDFIRRILRRALSQGLLNPRRVNKLLQVAVDNVGLDSGIGLRDMEALSRRLRLGPESLHTYALPTTPGRTPGGADVLYLDSAAATPILDVFRGKTDAPAVLLAGDVRVQVLDTSATRQRAAAAAYHLAASGFGVEGTAASAERPAKTTVRYPPNARPAAELIASHLAGGANLVEDATLPAGAPLTLTLGNDWRGVTAPSADATSTAPGPTTTPTTEATPQEDATAAAC